MERYQNPNWTTQFANLPEGWDIDPATFEQLLQERVFHCEGANCSIHGKALVKGEGMLKFLKVVATKAVMEEDGVTPTRDQKSGDLLFDRTDRKRMVLCAYHIYLEQLGVDEAMKNFPLALRKRGNKMEMETSTLFENLSWVKKMTRKAKRSERVAKFFLSLTEGTAVEVGVGLDYIKPFNPTTPKNEVHNYLIRGGEIIGLLFYDDVAVYHGVRHQHKAEFISANLYLYADSTLTWVEECLKKWRKGADEEAATKAAREAAAAERLAMAKALKEEELEGVQANAAELVAFFVGTATPTESSGGDNGRRLRAGNKPKQRKSSPPPSAARQIDEQLDASGRATPASDTPDVIVDDQAGSSKPTFAASLGERPEVASQIAAARTAIDSTE